MGAGQPSARRGSNRIPICHPIGSLHGSSWQHAGSSHPSPPSRPLAAGTALVPSPRGSGVAQPASCGTGTLGGARQGMFPVGMNPGKAGKLQRVYSLGVSSPASMGALRLFWEWAHSELDGAGCCRLARAGALVPCSEELPSCRQGWMEAASTRRSIPTLLPRCPHTPPPRCHPPQGSSRCPHTVPQAGHPSGAGAVVPGLRSAAGRVLRVLPIPAPAAGCAAFCIFSSHRHSNRLGAWVPAAPAPASRSAILPPGPGRRVLPARCGAARHGLSSWEPGAMGASGTTPASRWMSRSA